MDSKTSSLNATLPSPAAEVPTPQVAVIGAGHWGKNLVRNFHALGALAAVCDLDAEQLMRVVGGFDGEVRRTTHLKDILEDETIQGVVVATPTHTHCAIGEAVLNAGKHLYVEKPVATHAEDAERLLKLANAKDRVLMVGHLLLYHPAVIRLKHLIRQGYLGSLRYVQSERLNHNAQRQDKSVLWDLAPHDLSMLMDIIGAPPERILASTGHRTSVDGLVDVAHVELAFPGGIVGHIHTSWIHPVKQVRLIVRGSERTAVFDDTVAEGKLQIFHKDDPENTAPQESVTLSDYLTMEPLKVECQHFLNCIQQGSQPRSDGENGLMVVRILERAERKLKTA